MFAFGRSLPMPVMVTVANGLFVFGLTAYLWSLEMFYGVRPRAVHLLPALLATACVFWFSAFDRNFQVRLTAVSLAWIWLMLPCIRTLLRAPCEDSSLSRAVLACVFIIIAAFTGVRAVFFLGSSVPPDFAVESGASWMNLVAPIFMTLLPVIGTTLFVLMCSDHLRRRLEHAASTDYLTGLPNRRHLTESGKVIFRRAREEGTGFAAALLDIDAFKVINDRYGHDVGDRALVHVAGCLRARVRASDLVARSGGEEFVILFSDLDQEQATAAVELIRQHVAGRHLVVGAARIAMTVSAGVAVYRAGDKSLEDILRRADNALYSAKSCGRNRVELAA
jgi:diguanylate cyclase (GGDEF)-like protein